MKRTREQIKAEWMKKAEEEIDRLLDWEEKATDCSISNVAIGSSVASYRA